MGRGGWRQSLPFTVMRLPGRSSLGERVDYSQCDFIFVIFIQVPDHRECCGQEERDGIKRICQNRVD
jgi:hypothetical protein